MNASFSRGGLEVAVEAGIVGEADAADEGEAVETSERIGSSVTETICVGAVFVVQAASKKVNVERWRNFFMILFAEILNRIADLFGKQ